MVFDLRLFLLNNQSVELTVENVVGDMSKSLIPADFFCFVLPLIASCDQKHRPVACPYVPSLPIQFGQMDEHQLIEK